MKGVGVPARGVGVPKCSRLKYLQEQGLLGITKRLLVFPDLPGWDERTVATCQEKMREQWQHARTGCESIGNMPGWDERAMATCHNEMREQWQYAYMG